MGLFYFIIIEVVWSAIRFFCNAVWIMFKTIVNFMLLILKPVCKFLFKALPITVVLFSSVIVILLSVFLWDKIINRKDRNQLDIVNVEVQVSSDNKFIDDFMARAELRLEKLEIKITSLLEYLTEAMGGGEAGFFTLFLSMIVLVALLPIILLIVFVMAIVIIFIEILPISLSLDISRHIYVFIRYKPDIRNTLLAWTQYALSDCVHAEKEDDMQ